MTLKLRPACRICSGPPCRTRNFLTATSQVKIRIGDNKGGGGLAGCFGPQAEQVASGAEVAELVDVQPEDIDGL